MDKKVALETFLRGRSVAYYQSLSEAISFDRQMRLPPDAIAATMGDFLKAKSIRNRCEFVP